MNGRRKGRAQQALDERVNRALSDIEARNIRGLEDLYDLLGRPVYALCKLNTQHLALAEDAMVEAFRQVWAAASTRPTSSSTGVQWVLDVACRCAREVQAMQLTRYDRREVPQPAV